MSGSRHQLELVARFCGEFPDEVVRLLQACQPGETAEALDQLPQPRQLALLQRMPPGLAARIVMALGEQRGGELLGQLPVFQLGNILRPVPGELRQRFVARLPLRQQGLLHVLLSYAEDAVGAWAAEPLTATAETRAGEVPALVRLAGVEPASPWIHVLDEEHRLMSSVRISDCLRLPPGQPLGQTRLTPLAQLNGATPLTAALTHPHWRATDWVAVTDAGRLLVGELSHLRLRQALGRSQPADEQKLRADIALTLAEAYGATLGALAGAMVEKTEPARRAAGE